MARVALRGMDQHVEKGAGGGRGFRINTQERISAKSNAHCSHEYNFLPLTKTVQLTAFKLSELYA